MRRPLVIFPIFALGLACGGSAPSPGGAAPGDRGYADLGAAADAGSADRFSSTDGRAAADVFSGGPSLPDGSARADRGPGPAPGPDPSFEVAMTYTTANIGRSYSTAAEVRQVFAKIEGVIGAKAGPKHIGWQEIGAADPCGATCEIDAIRNCFTAASGWETVHPMGQKPGGGSERVNVPISSAGANEQVSTRATFASPAWAGVSATRFVTVSFHASRNLSLVNTHFIAGAWSCQSEVVKRRDYWKQAWQVLKSEVAKEQGRGRNVVVTGDLNRPRAANNCNPAWDPTSLHAQAKIIGGAGIDYVYAVPAAGYRFEISRAADGTRKEGSIALGIDGHQAHWVKGSFLSK